jgi:hypothetical protein
VLWAFFLGLLGIVSFLAVLVLVFNRVEALLRSLVAILSWLLLLRMTLRAHRRFRD